MTLQLRELQRQYVGPDGAAVPVVDVKRFELESGRQVGLVGRSGSGKTTLLYLIAGILRADSGSITYSLEGSESVDIAPLSEAQRDIFRGKHLGYIFQTHQLLPAFTALENVLLGMSFTGRHEDRAWAEHLLTEVGLADRMKYRPGKLSVGQQQRVAVARALANRPAVVLADEPTGALDPDHAQVVVDLIRQLCREVSATLLLVSHDMQIVGQLDRVVKFEELNRRDDDVTRSHEDTKDHEAELNGGGGR